MEVLKKIPFSDLTTIPAGIRDFLSGDLPGYSEQLFNRENADRKITEKRDSFTSSQRTLLCSVLERAHAENPTVKQHENLAALRSENTFTVTTGHQLNLNTGPVYFIYKILQTIKTSEFLNRTFPQYRTVPVFWMASEDHDFEEISHFKTENSTYRIPGENFGPVGRRVPEDVNFIKKFQEEFRQAPFGDELISLLQEAYAPGHTLAQATQIICQQLFGEAGLLILDGDDRELKASMTKIFKDELLGHTLKNTTRQTVELLTQRYGKVQVNPRDINLFYLTSDRQRIDSDGEGFVLADRSVRFEPSEILAELQEFPERFSPNALLRPVYQETVLPNIAYIGGNAEILYWLQLKDCFASLKLPYPLLVPRNSLLFLKKKTLEKAARLGLSPEDFFKDFNTVTANLLLKNTQLQSLLEETRLAVEQGFNTLKMAASGTDKTFGTLVEAEQARQLKAFNRMQKRLLRAEKRKQQEKVEALENVFRRIHPEGVWQERIFNFSVFYAQDGGEWLRTCYSAIDVEESALTLLRL